MRYAWLVEPVEIVGSFHRCVSRWCDLVGGGTFHTLSKCTGNGDGMSLCVSHPFGGAQILMTILPMYTNAILSSNLRSHSRQENQTKQAAGIK